uniref:Chromosome 12 open reading frame 50 n=1 Tax=Capra hircus TaxID=9925 RepID=A0A452EV88_CAPHI
MEMQQNCSISCFWETQPLGCVKISCIFYHSKPRNINGLFLPPSSTILLQKDNILQPTHHPLILKLTLRKNRKKEVWHFLLFNASSLWTKTPEEIEEKRAIKEMCYKSGEYYRVHTPSDISSSKSLASIVEKEIEKSLESGSELQEGDGLTVPTKFSRFERQGEIKASLDKKPRTDIAAFENGGGDCYIPQRIIFLGVDENEALTEEKESTISQCSNAKDNKDSPHLKRSLTTRLVPTTHVLNATENISMKCREDLSSMNDVHPVMKPHFKGVKKRKWIYDEPKNFPGPGMRRAVQPSNPKNKMSYHRNNKNKNSENASYIHVQRGAVRTVSLNAPPHGRPTHGSYNKADVNKEPKFNLCSDKYMSTSYNGSVWRKRIPFSKTYSKNEKIYTEPRRNGSK